MSTIWDYYCSTCKSTKGFLTPMATSSSLLEGNKAPVSLKLNFVASLHSMPSTEDRDVGKLEYSIVISYGAGDNVKDNCKEEFGATEVVKGSLDPCFKDVFSLNWTKGKKQHLCFCIKGLYRANESVSVGFAPLKVCMATDEYVQKGENLKIELEGGGYLVVQKVTPVAFKLAGMKIPRKDMFHGKSDPYVQCYWRVGENNDQDDTQFQVTKHIDDTENPEWEERVTFKNYIKGANMWLRFVMMDYDPASEDDLIGEALINADALVEAKTIETKMSGDPKGEATLIVTTVAASKF